MLVLEIRLSEGHVPHGHGQGRVPKQLLQREGIAAVPEELHGEGVPEPMRVAIVYAGCLAKTLRELQQTAPCQALPGANTGVGAEERGWRLTGILLQITPECLSRFHAEPHHPMLVTLPQDATVAGLHVSIPYCEVTYLRCSNTSVQEEQHDGFIASGVWAAPGSLQEGISLLRCEGHDLVRSVGRGPDRIHRGFLAHALLDE
ncbi:MAG TPA: hypothetical protein PLJ31_19345, partial [Armatimonadota bacterium]|nr:hypothetical protein [Armatimonadota bacterium]